MKDNLILYVVYFHTGEFESRKGRYIAGYNTKEEAEKYCNYCEAEIIKFEQRVNWIKNYSREEYILEYKKLLTKIAPTWDEEIEYNGIYVNVKKIKIPKGSQLM